MNEDIKKDWVKALRSGKYSQGSGKLKIHYRDAFCCLGVLCEIHPKVRLGDDGYYFEGDNYDFNMISALSKKFMEEVKLHDNEMQYLIEMNDTKGFDFKRIADYIEREL